ncbi:FAD-dependent oxidoreductase [Litoribacterium kuwaitense]|uniref:FAD-dependent oxidoreductase n=1 Tax=Litoribacterium kuwaitense TaxID=1398745 RepID=UPI001FE53253|nr:FAD-dependent oxidoreductase [Litoribacterium kuwaitense]
MTQESQQWPQKPLSLWRDAARQTTQHPPLQQSETSEVVIIGGGLTGLTTAYLLAKEGKDVVLLEAGRLMTGTSGHTTAKVTVQHDLIYDEFLAHFGHDAIEAYYRANDEALRWMKALIAQHQIDCDWTEESAYLYTSQALSVDKLEREMRAYDRLNIPGQLVRQGLPDYMHAKLALMVPNQAHFHPVKYAAFLLTEAERMGARIYEQTTAMKLTDEQRPVITCDNGSTVTADHVLICSHFPFIDQGGFYFTRMHASRSYVLALESPTPPPQGMFLEVDPPQHSWRAANSTDGTPLLLLGGEGHKTGQGLNTHEPYEQLLNYAKKTVGVTNVHYRWSAQDLITSDKMPYVGPITRSHPNICIATGFRKWGMTNSTQAARQMARYVTEGKAFLSVSVPSRFKADPSLKHMARENADVAKHFARGKFGLVAKTPADVNKGEGAVVRYQGQRAGLYKDASGKAFLVDTTCTHLGCEVDWNDGDCAWECPCHGSRFAPTGEVLNGPAKKPLKRLFNED